MVVVCWEVGSEHFEGLVRPFVCIDRSARNPGSYKPPLIAKPQKPFLRRKYHSEGLARNCEGNRGLASQQYKLTCQLVQHAREFLTLRLGERSDGLCPSNEIVGLVRSIQSRS
jgi:hypothetical protein